MKVAFAISFALLFAWPVALLWLIAEIPEPPVVEVVVEKNPYYAATEMAAEYRSLPDCGQPGQPNTPNPCSDENVLKILQIADDTAILFQALEVQVRGDPDATPEARRAAIVWAEHAALAFKETVSSITQRRSP